MSDRPVDTLTPLSGMQWNPLPGFPGIESLTLADNLDEAKKVGHRTRLVRFAPGVETTKPLIHDYHEEAMLLSGDLSGIREAERFGRFTEEAYVHRPPGTPHGPIRSEGGCVLLEVQYYA
ncbi:MAG: cupin domain-containing protein [Amaricoccus sp.]|uniref:cupin domain-containing protein n=1 Tax=Amaricoccus sp. TaxID=1872485 RepID=UPI0039E5B763